MMGTASEGEKHMMTCDKQRFDKGFTLGELLIVVAIVLVLVAIAVPVFTGTMAKAEEATCDANRRSLKGAIADAYILNNGINAQDTFTEYQASFMGSNGNKPLCPSAGTYTLDDDFANGLVIVKCSVHGVSMDEEVYAWVVDTYKDSWDKYYGSDTDVWKKYFDDKKISEWPPVTGTDGETRYLKFKSFSNNGSGVFLYAGEKNDLSNDWRAHYICDSAGYYGKAGQWYEVPQGKEGVANLTKDSFVKLLEESRPVNLVDKKFVAA